MGHIHKLIFCLLIIWLAPSFQPCLGATIQEINSIDEIVSELNKADDETLILFDVDQTLTVPSDLIFSNKELRRKIFKAHQIEDSNMDVKFLIISQYREQLTEPQLAPIITGLIEKGKKVIAWTRRSGGNSPGNVIPKLEYFTFYLLQKLGIDFRKSFSQYEEIYFDRRKPSPCGQYPVFKWGILYCDDLPKEELLEEFLEAVRWKPKLIILIDDLSGNIEDMKKECSKLGISFKGYLYSGWKKSVLPVNEKLASFQVKYLLAHKKWLSDTEAKSLMQKKHKV